MAKAKVIKLKHSCADFGLGELLFVPIDGDEHELVRCYTTPSAVIRANRLPEELSGFAVAYFSARSQGLFEALGFEETGDVEEDVLNFFDRYASTPAELVEGGDVAAEGEPDPTK